jgi:carbamoyl-phosphate synthase large subunit
MPRRSDLKTILILGSGPIVIGQAAEFDYSGTQACKALRAAGYRVVLINSNPATIMTDPAVADRTYVEPLTVESATAVIERERPDALLPTLGGQTALNLAKSLHEEGVLERHGVELIGANYQAIRTGEDRAEFAAAMARIGLQVPRGRTLRTPEAAQTFAREIGFPVVVRPSFTLGGAGGGIARDADELAVVAARGLRDSPVHQVLVEECLIGWKEFELEVMRDQNDTVVIICSIENFDPMGVHTGDSITVAPAQTLSDKEYQRLRDAAVAIIREVGVETGGSNIQFAIDPADGRVLVIEMNPRVSRSSALASKATGFPIAKIAALLAVGYHLDELPNDITRETKSAFEPSIDYVVTKIPRFAFDKFPGVPDDLGTQMQAVGEVMAIGRTFKESLLKALRSLEADTRTLVAGLADDELLALMRPSPRRVFAVLEALHRGFTVDELHRRTAIDRWFLAQMAEIVAAENEAVALGPVAGWPREVLFEAKRTGLSDRRLASLTGTTEEEVRRVRYELGVRPVFKTVDTCAAEFEAYTPYHYSTYEEEDEVRRADRPSVVILGSGPNRIGQGVEFDYATVHAVWALREAGFETIMVNSNPETVSTDYDTADRLFFEPLTVEDVLHIVDRERPVGVIATLGGQTPLRLARALAAAGAPMWGTSPDAIHRAEDRHEFNALCARLGLLQPRGAVASGREEALVLAEELGYPLMVRPSYVLGGRAMRVVQDRTELVRYLDEVYALLDGSPSILLDLFLDGAVEVDVDALCDGTDVYIGGVMEHIELAGVHSGDSACFLPPVALAPETVAELEAITARLALEIGVKGLINVQFALLEEGGRTAVYVLEANPRASRSVPFVSKATGVPLAKVAARIMAGRSLAADGLVGPAPRPPFYSVKEVVLPFHKFKNADPRLGPEMKSTGESMGIDSDPALAYLKALLGANVNVPRGGAAGLAGAGLEEVAASLKAAGFEVQRNPAQAAGLDLVIDLAAGPLARDAVRLGIPYVTTREAAIWLARAVRARPGQLSVTALQELHTS